MEPESSMIRLRGKQENGTDVKTSNETNLPLKCKTSKKKLSNDTIICGFVILVSITVILYRSKIVSIDLLPKFKVRLDVTK